MGLGRDRTRDPWICLVDEGTEDPNTTKTGVIGSSRACLFGSQTMREFSEPVSRNRLGQGHR